MRKIGHKLGESGGNQVKIWKRTGNGGKLLSFIIDLVLAGHYSPLSYFVDSCLAKEIPFDSDTVTKLSYCSFSTAH